MTLYHRSVSRVSNPRPFCTCQMVSRPVTECPLHGEAFRALDREKAELAANIRDEELGESRCHVCGERGADAEMYRPGSDSVVCHAECGLSAGMEVA